MNQRFLSVLVFAFVVAAGASFMLYRLMAGRVKTEAAPVTVKVVLAARNLELGTLIRDGDLRLGDWPGTRPAGALMKREDLVGRGVISPIYANEPILESRLAPKGAGGGLAATIPKGLRAVAVRVNEVVGVAGFVTPGMRVDVLISGSPPSANGNRAVSVTRTLLQNVEVLSAGQEYKKDSEGKPIVVQVVNLLVNPEGAEKLSLAINQTTIQLVLRNPLDTEIAKTSGTALTQLYAMGGPDPDRPAKPAKRKAARVAPPVPVVKPVPREPFVMEVINGAKKTEAKFSAAAAEAKQ